MCKVLIQIGCNNGDDHVFQHVKENNDYDRIILIDANPKCLEIAKQQYSSIKNAEFYNYAISTNGENEVELYLPDDEDTHMCASLSKNHLILHCNHDRVYSIKVPAIGINGLFEKLNVDKIDRLIIDTEGLDVKIVNQIDFNKYEIPYLAFEYIHSDGTCSFGGENLNKTLDKLRSLDYNLSTEEYNYIAQK